MQLKSRSFAEGEAIPGEFAFAVANPATHVTFSSNRNPHFAWSDVPQETRSFALICVDPDVPSRGDDVNQEGREIPASLPRVEFYHWLLWDIPPATREIQAGTHSHGVTPRGKPGPTSPGGRQHGINDFTGWFAGDQQMRGTYYGYDGPCPPWNDPLVHHYVFTLYALDTAHLEIAGSPTGQAVTAALAKHVLAKAALTGTYTLNPRLIQAR